MAEFNTDLPSIRQVQTYIKDKQQLEIKLLTNDVVVGTVFWQDENCICLKDAQQTQILISRSAIAYLKPKG